MNVAICNMAYSSVLLDLYIQGSLRTVCGPVSLSWEGMSRLPEQSHFLLCSRGRCFVCCSNCSKQSQCSWPVPHTCLLLLPSQRRNCQNKSLGTSSSKCQDCAWLRRKETTFTMPVLPVGIYWHFWAWIDVSGQVMDTRLYPMNTFMSLWTNMPSVGAKLPSISLSSQDCTTAMRTRDTECIKQTDKGHSYQCHKQ